MKRINILYWVFTILLAVGMTFSSIPDLISSPEAVTIIKDHLGYPAYLIPFLGVAKLLAVIAILVPGFSRLKEWAYAGLVFDIAGAQYSSISVGDPVSAWLPITIGYILIGLSYFFYHKKLKATLHEDAEVKPFYHAT